MNMNFHVCLLYVSCVLGSSSLHCVVCIIVFIILIHYIAFAILSIYFCTNLTQRLHLAMYLDLFV